MIRSGTTFKSWAFAFLCFYACCYPICALLFLNEETASVGSKALQAFQGATILALAVLWKARVSFRVLNLWFPGCVYFTIIALYFALFRAFDERGAELTYALRFIFWFIFAFALENNVFSSDQIRKLVGYFWFGTLIQCGIGIACYVFDLGGGSIYSDINASAGSKNVSGKMVVSFVVLEIILSFYWFVRSQKKRFRFLIAILSGVLVMLFSFNRAGQLGLFVATLWGLGWLVSHNRMKYLLPSSFGVAVAVFFLASMYGEFFMQRWEQLERDQGSGRVEIANAAITNVFEPRSPEALFIGRGYHKTKNLMYGVFGVRIGTHSDLLDFLTAYGLIGLAFYIAIIRKFFSYSRNIGKNSLERLCCRASTIAFVVMSVVTGVFQGTYAVLIFLFFMRYYQDEAKRLVLAKQAASVGVVPGAPLPPDAPLKSYARLNSRLLSNLSVTPDGIIEEPKRRRRSTRTTGDNLENRVAPPDATKKIPENVDSEEAFVSKQVGENDAVSEPAKGAENVESNLPGKSENIVSSGEETRTSDLIPEFDDETSAWLKGVDSIYADVDEVDNFMKVASAEEKDSAKDEAERERAWLNGLDSIYGDFDEMSKMLTRDANQTVRRQ